MGKEIKRMRRGVKREGKEVVITIRGKGELTGKKIGWGDVDKDELSRFEDGFK